MLDSTDRHGGVERDVLAFFSCACSYVGDADGRVRTERKNESARLVATIVPPLHELILQRGAWTFPTELVLAGDRHVALCYCCALAPCEKKIVSFGRAWCW